MTRTLRPLTLAALATCAAAQSDPAPVWHEARAFDPISATAMAITGPIAFADGRLTFDSKAAVPLTSVGTRRGDWDSNGGEQTAEIFRLGADPGTLLNGNTLCAGRARYLVVYADDAYGPTLNTAVFDSEAPPQDIDSPGLCGTFSYDTS